MLLMPLCETIPSLTSKGSFYSSFQELSFMLMENNPGTFAALVANLYFVKGIMLLTGSSPICFGKQLVDSPCFGFLPYH